MSQSINLVPQQEKLEQTKEQIVKLSTVMSVVLLVVISIASALLFYQTYKIKKEIKQHESNVADSRSRIKGLAGVEINARNLDAKYQTLGTILSTRLYYSNLLNEFKIRLPSSIKVNDFSINGDNNIALTGSADNYISIGQFIHDLTDKSFPGVTRGLEGLFTNVVLNSVNSDTQNHGINFFIVISFDTKLLQKL